MVLVPIAGFGPTSTSPELLTAASDAPKCPFVPTFETEGSCKAAAATSSLLIKLWSMAPVILAKRPKVKNAKDTVRPAMQSVFREDGCQHMPRHKTISLELVSYLDFI